MAFPDLRNIGVGETDQFPGLVYSSQKIRHSNRNITPLLMRFSLITRVISIYRIALIEFVARNDETPTPSLGDLGETNT